MWQTVRRLLGMRDPRPAHASPPPRRSEYPASFLPASHPQPPAPERLVFDPALLHFPQGLRLPDPSELPADRLAVWSRARQDAMDHLLRLVAALPAGKDLVLRGSVALRSWFPAQARVARDIDWVVRSPGIVPDGQWSAALFADLLAAIAGQPDAGLAILEPGGAGLDDIWTYERAEGRRLVVPWRTADGLPGSAQMDVVFGEPLPEEPVTCAIPGGDGRDIVVPCASRTTSLAWKLLWLSTDMHPQGKDLYDAVLLAEGATLPPGLVARVFAAADASLRDLRRPTTEGVDWANFLKEYPQVAGDAADWQQRLATALAGMPGWDAPVPVPAPAG